MIEIIWELWGRKITHALITTRSAVIVSYFRSGFFFFLIFFKHGLFHISVLPFYLFFMCLLNTQGEDVQGIEETLALQIICDYPFTDR